MRTFTIHKQKPMKTYYILKAIDCFGDLWPLNTMNGIDGTHDTIESAKASADRFTSEKEFRCMMREQNGWEKNSIRSLQIDEVCVS
jgi:hypothetical protein